jgi:hypothetical protein
MHREVALGTLRSALKMAGVSPEEFSDALQLHLIFAAVFIMAHRMRKRYLLKIELR